MRLWKNSKYVKKGDAFLLTEENEKYVNEAIKNKCKYIISETNKEYSFKTINTEDVDDYLINEYKDTISDLILIGVTGTNGKTTTSYLIYEMLNSIGVKTAYIGTIGFYHNDKKEELNNTTPSIDLIYNFLLTSKEENIKVVVMEVSSHALKQDRVKGLLFDAVIVTNVTGDHLDYHKTFTDYLNSKRKIITLLKNKKICILNNKDKYYHKFISNNNYNVIIGKDLKIKKVKYNLNSTFLLFDDKNINISLVGKFNVYNFLMAYKTIELLGFDTTNILLKSKIYKAPPGRMERIEYKTNSIFIDYAHTPDAVLKVLKTIRKIKNKGIITIIGCGGNREKEKRPLMGKIASKYSNYVIYTNDNPRNESENDIMNDIINGVKKSNYEIIYDRALAIKKGIEMLKDNNILLILGKGHENYQIIKDNKIYFSDKDEVLKNIK